jgi:hypothetical protein
MDNVHKVYYFTNEPSSQTFRTYLYIYIFARLDFKLITFVRLLCFKSVSNNI